MPRAIWKGAISFGLVTVPVGLYAATERAREIHFRLLHAKDASPIDYKRVCEAEGVEVPWPEIVRGYEYTKGEFIVVTDKELAAARGEASQAFAIRDFVPARDIAPLYFDEPYYLAPTDKIGAKAYALLRDALNDTERAGIGTIVLRQRERLAALAPAGRLLTLSTLRFAHEIRSADTLDLPAAGRAGARELALARQLVEALASAWDPARYRDTYHEVLRELIERKAQGEEIAVPTPRKPARVVNLMDALKQSLEQPRSAHRPAGARRRPRRPARRGARRVA